MKVTKRVMIFSGFLGSGKTTTMVNTAQYLKAQGIKVGIITNDLGSNLVDTNYVDKEALPVAEIPDGCLCHDVPNFTAQVEALYAREQPDIIFAEPVGSCVDLVKNVYYEIARNYPNLTLAPFTSVIDPVRYQSIYMGIGENTFAPQITYMYKKQLEEADILLLNKIDTLTADRTEAILASLKHNFPTKTVVAISAVRQQNLAAWTGKFMNGQAAGLTDLDIDWDYIVQAENTMGWCNKHFTLSSAAACDFNVFAEKLLQNLQTDFGQAQIEIAHLKLMLSTDKEYCKLALTGTGRDIFFARKFDERNDRVEAIINVRAQTTPKVLEQVVETNIQKTVKACELTIKNQITQVFDSFAHAPQPVVVA